MSPPQKLNHPRGVLDLCVLIRLADIVYKGLGTFDEIHYHLLEFIRSTKRVRRAIAIWGFDDLPLCMNWVRGGNQERGNCGGVRDVPQWPASNVSSDIFGKNCFARGILRSLIYLLLVPLMNKVFPFHFVSPGS